jgi:predicted dienelactone hydrolase
MSRFLLVALSTLVFTGMLFSMDVHAAEQEFPVGTTTQRFDLKQLKLPRTVTAAVWYPATTPGENSPVAAGKFSVLLYYPGWGGKVSDNASLLENLARHGFVAVGLSYPDGARLPNPAVPMKFVPDAGYAEGTAQGNRMVQIEAEDGSRVFDALEQMDQTNAGGRFAGHLDTKRAGVLGYSLGGSVAAQTALHDPRFLAVMNLDGWMFGDVATQFFSQPYLVISDVLAAPTDAELASSDVFVRNFSGLRAKDAKHQTAQLERSGGYRVTIAGSSHFTFSDHAKANQDNAGPVDPKHAMEIVSACAVDFFGKHLDARVAPFLDQGKANGADFKVEKFRGQK